jgi:hypothetical protein
VDYRRDGGLIGAQDHLVIGMNRHATLTRKSGALEFYLSADRFTQLQAALQGADFPALSQKMTAQGFPADAFLYHITYQGIPLQTADSLVPDKLLPAIQLLNVIIDTSGK